MSNELPDMRQARIDAALIADRQPRTAEWIIHESECAICWLAYLDESRMCQLGQRIWTASECYAALGVIDPETGKILKEPS